MSSHSSLFQPPSLSGSNPLTDSRVRKTLKLVNMKSEFHSAYFTFIILEGRGQLLPLIHMYQYKILKDTEFGLLTVYDNTSSQTIPLVKSVALALAATMKNG